MIYKDFKGKRLSGIGMGTMRFPVIDGRDGSIDVPAAVEMIDYAYSNGINYFDTAYGYHEGNSQIVVGEALSKYPRDSFYLATKFPGYDLENFDHIEEIFEKQLKDCRVEYFDFYLLHNINDQNLKLYLDKNYGACEYFLKQKELGRIRHLGFSTHGNIETFTSFMNIYGEHMEFCQIQVNWLDWEFQEAKLKVEMLNEKGIPVWAMEPLRGGSLLLEPGDLENSFHFLQTIPGMTVILTGASTLEQLKENIGCFQGENHLSEEQFDALLERARKMTAKTSVPCTKCHYCTPHCPIELDIPRILSLYNEHKYSNGGWLAPLNLSALDRDKRPKDCIGCGACERVCPQNLTVSEYMADFAEMLKK